ncbi:MAG TPA: MFS transporter [Roseiarcus sp.]|jgi:MFS family permease
MNREANIAAGAAARPVLSARGIFAVVLGNGYEFFDFGVYAVYIGVIGQTFFPAGDTLASDLAAAATFGVGFFARPLGGLLIGAYGDRAGRKAAMTLTIALMALGSGMIAVLPGYSTIGAAAPVLLVLARLVQGFAVGGEMGPSTLFMLEAAPPGRRMFYGSWQLASQNLGALAYGLVGAATALALSKASLNDWGWRLPFALGVLIAPVGVYIRNALEETLSREPHVIPPRVGALVAVVLREHWRGVVVGVVLIAGSTIAQYFLVSMTPYAIRTLHLPEATAMIGAVTLGATGAIGALIGGLLADRFGVKTVAIAPRILMLIALLPVMEWLVATPSVVTLALAVGLLSVLQGLSGGPALMLIPRLFPKAARSTGLAFTYSLGVAVFGGTATAIVTWLVEVTGNPLASAYYVLGGNLVMVAAILAVPDSDEG